MKRTTRAVGRLATVSLFALLVLARHVSAATNAVAGEQPSPISRSSLSTSSSEPLVSSRSPEVLALRYAVLLGGKATKEATAPAAGVLSHSELTGFLSEWNPDSDSEEVRQVFALNSLGEVVRQAALLPLDGGSLAGDFEREGVRVALELGVQVLPAGNGAIVSAEISQNGEVIASPRVALGFGVRAVLSTELAGSSRPLVFIVVEVLRTTRDAVTARGVLGSWTPESRMVDGVKVKAPRLLESPPPRYPEEARKADVEGVATVAVTIGVDGHVEAADLLDDPGHGLGEAAVAAVKTWRYESPTEAGRPIRATMVLTVRFTLP